MVALQAIVEECGRKLGLPARPGKPAVFGELAGIPVELLAGADGSAHFILYFVRLGAEDQGPALREHLAASGAVKEAGIKPAEVAIDGDLLVLKEVSGLRGLKAEATAQKLVALATAVKEAAPPLAEPACAVCRGESGEAPGLVLLNGVIQRVCPPCVGSLRAHAAEVQAALDARSTNVLAALSAGIILALLGGAAWAAVAVGTERMFWLLAIGIGWVVGWGTNKAAGRGGFIVQAISVICTLASVLLGQVFFIAYHVQRAAEAQGATVDWNEFVRAVPDLLIETGGDTGFALLGGVFGAYYATRLAARDVVQMEIEES